MHEQAGEQRDRARERLVQVAVAESAYTAELLRDQLAQAGIAAMVRNRDGASPWLGPLGSAYSHELLVLEGDADAANALIGDGPPAPELSPPKLAPSSKRAARPRRRWWR